jgi:hypothetical protein
VHERPVRASRPEPREVVELRQLKTDHPELTSAIDMQIALLEMQRRIQSRVPLPWLQMDPLWLQTQNAAGRPVVRFSDIPLNWTDFRLIFRQTADILRRFESLEQPEYERLLALGRDGNAIRPLVTQGYEATSGVDGGDPRFRAPDGSPASLDQVLVLALRPFLARCAEVLTQRTDVPSWTHGHCPFCGWEAEFSVITSSGDRRLICGRCGGQWAFGPIACPYCANEDRTLITSFATPDGRYRVAACDVCKRYLKAFDARRSDRPVLIGVDTIATLPLDAAAMQRGYVG